MKDTARRAVVVALLVAAAGVSSASGRQEPAPARVVEITAERFEFVPSEITAEEGETLEFRLTSQDTIHGFRLVGPDGTGRDVAIPKRGRGDVRVRFEATAEGRYTFECSRLCGAGHGFMRGTVNVKARPAQGGGS
jgi:cytochrome c oxidase subunit 2